MIAFLNKIRTYRWRWIGRRKIKSAVNSCLEKGKPLKIILGASDDRYDGWIPTDIPHFDASNSADWARFFPLNSIDNLLAEHVYEHLTLAETKKSFLLMKNYLKPGAVFRIAVPDGYHASSDYVDYVKPGTTYSGWENHQLLWNKDMLSEVAAECGYEATFLQYYDSNRQFTDTYVDDENGVIARTFEKLKNDKSRPYTYTSLIADLRISPPSRTGSANLQDKRNA